MSKRLSEYGIKPKDVRTKSGVQKGYDLAQFSDVFMRYIDSKNDFSSESENLSATTLQTSTHAAYSVADDFKSTPLKNLSATLQPAPSLICSVVADKNRENDENLKKKLKSEFVADKCTPPPDVYGHAFFNEPNAEISEYVAAFEAVQVDSDGVEL